MVKLFVIRESACLMLIEKAVNSRERLKVDAFDAGTRAGRLTDRHCTKTPCSRNETLIQFNSILF